MVWVIAVLVALAAFALAVFAFKLKRALWTSLLAALTFGLAGYAMQASPGLDSQPKAPEDARPDDGFDSLEARLQLVHPRDRSRLERLMTPGNAMMRARRYADAVAFYNGVTDENPEDFEAWLGKGTALVDHANGALTPPAVFAYRKAAEIKPGHPAPGYFLGVSLIRQGRMMEARQVWRETVAEAPADAAGLDSIIIQLDRLEGLLGVPEEQRISAASAERATE